MKLDYLNGTKYSIYQPNDMYHFNSDTELLGRFMHIHKNDHVLDIGCNNGALLYYAKEKHAKSLCGIDLFEEVIENARSNFERNAVEVELYVCSLQQFKHEQFNVIVCNPPYFNTQNDALKNQNEYIKAARHEEYLTLDVLFQNVKRLLKSNGSFSMVYRPDRISEVILYANQYGFSLKRMRLAYAYMQKNAKTVLFEFVMNQNTTLIVEEPAFLNDRSSFGWKGIQTK